MVRRVIYCPVVEGGGRGRFSPYVFDSHIWQRTREWSFQQHKIDNVVSLYFLSSVECFFCCRTRSRGGKCIDTARSNVAECKPPLLSHWVPIMITNM